MTENRKEYIKRYRLENSEMIKESRRKYCLENKDKMKESRKKRKDRERQSDRDRYHKNKEKMNEKQRQYHNNRILIDPLYKISCNIKGLIKSSFYRKFTKKSLKTIKILGCSFDEFKIYIEEKFIGEMNWKNQGRYWELDHITPVSWANSEEEIIRLNHYTNFQPLKKEDNRRKSNKYSG